VLTSRRRIAFLLVCAVGGSGGPLSAQVPPADEIVERNLEARGGLSRLQAVNTIRITGTVAAQGMELPLVLTAKRPSLMHQQITVQGRSIVSVFDGERAWSINPLSGSSDPREVRGIQAEAMREQSAFDGPLVGYRERGDALEVVGTAEVEDTPTYRLKLTRQSGRVIFIDVDAATALERRWSATLEDDGVSIDIETLMSDYAPTDGIQVARTLQTFIGGQPQGVLTIREVEFDVPVDDALFEFPDETR
jgi:outer membrane lipoprotein-sorting protein